MARLNIPFSRNHRKIRHARRVFLAVCVVIITVWAAAWKGADAWFTRDTVFLAAPIGTVAEIRFTPKKADWEILSSYFGDTPLISGRPLTIKNIQPITDGEFAVFIAEDGTTSLGIRSKDIPEDTLDSLGIVVQSPVKTVYLLSDRILPLQTHPKPYGWVRHLFTAQSGEIRLFKNEGGDSVAYPIRLAKDALYIRLNGEKTIAAPWKFIPDQTLLALSTPEWTEKDLGNILFQITRTWGEGAREIFSPTLNKNEEKNPVFLWRGSGDGSPVLMSGTSSMDTNGLQNLLRVLASASEPKTRDLILPDTSTVEEWYADPSSVSVETLTRSGVPVYRAVGNTSTYFAAQKEGRFAFTNTETALSSWLGETNKENLQISCSYALYFDLSSYKEGVQDGLHLTKKNFFGTFVSHLPYLRIEPGSNPWMIFTKEICG